MKRRMKSLSVIILACCIGVSCVACNGSESKDSTTTAATTATEATTTTEITTSTTEETTTAEATSATSYVENIGEIYVSDVKYLSEKEYTEISTRASNGGWVKLGIDNPNNLEQARKYFEDDTLTLEDVGFFQCDMLSDSDYFSDALSSYEPNYVGACLSTDIVRYILALNGDRFFISQISYDFYARYFPDYVEKYKKNKDVKFVYKDPVLDTDALQWDEQDLTCLYFQEFYNKFETKGEKALSDFLAKDKEDPEAHESVKLYLFWMLTKYNSAWFRAATYYNRSLNFMPIAKTTEGQYIVAPSKTPFNQLQKRVNQLSKCENLDITKPETYEDLINSGVNVDLIEKAFDYAGIDIPKLPRSNDQSSDQQ